jgi:hypothetical protein
MEGILLLMVEEMPEAFFSFVLLDKISGFTHTDDAGWGL